MNDPKRLTEAETGPLRDLLRAARDVPAPPAEALGRMLGTLGLSAGVTGSAGVGLGAGAGPSSLMASVSPWFVGGVLLGAASLGTWQLVAPPSPNQPLPPLASAASVTRKVPPRLLPRTAAVPQQEFSIPLPFTSEGPGPAPAASIIPHRGESKEESRAAPATPSKALEAELRALNRAREALRAGDLSEAEQALQGFRQTFPQGQLRPESELLRLELLGRQGRSAAAQELATELEQTAPSQRYREQIRALAAGAEKNLEETSKSRALPK